MTVKPFDQGFKYLGDEDAESLLLLLGVLKPGDKASIEKLPTELSVSTIIADQLYLVTTEYDDPFIVHIAESGAGQLRAAVAVDAAAFLLEQLQAAQLLRVHCAPVALCETVERRVVRGAHAHARAGIQSLERFDDAVGQDDSGEHSYGQM